jgi:hypothetical protein
VSVDSGQSEELEESLALFLPFFSEWLRGFITRGKLVEGAMALRGRPPGLFAGGELVEGEMALGGRPRGCFAGGAEVVDGNCALGGRPRGRFTGYGSVEASFGFRARPRERLDADVAVIGSHNCSSAGGVTPDGTSKSEELMPASVSTFFLRRSVGIYLNDELWHQP